MRNKIFSIFICFLTFSVLAYGKQEVSFKIKKPSSAEFAKKTNIQMEVTYPKNYSLTLDKKSLNLKDFKIVGIEKKQKNSNQTSFILTVVPFVLGKVDFPSLDWVLKSKNEAKIIQSPKFGLEIAEIKKPKDLKNEIYEIFGIYKPTNYYLIFGSIVLGLLLVFIIYLFKKKNKTKTFKIKDNRPAHIIALDEIEHLQYSNLWQEGKIKLFYIKLSDILRDYLQRRFEIHAHKFTSLDLCRELKKIIKDKKLLSDIKTFSTVCDLVKFAKNLPSEKQKEQDIFNLKNIIASSKPKEEISQIKNET